MSASVNVSFDDHVLMKIREMATSGGLPFSKVVNRLLKSALETNGDISAPDTQKLIRAARHCNMTVGVRGTLTKFKRWRGVAKSVNVPQFKIGQNLSIPTSPCQVSPPAAPARQAFGGPDQRHRARRGNPRRTPENPRAWRARAESVAAPGIRVARTISRPIGASTSSELGAIGLL